MLSKVLPGTFNLLLALLFHLAGVALAVVGVHVGIFFVLQKHTHRFHHHRNLLVQLLHGPIVISLHRGYLRLHDLAHSFLFQEHKAQVLDLEVLTRDDLRNLPWEVLVEILHFRASLDKR